jgi:hypothetical protein
VDYFIIKIMVTKVTYIWDPDLWELVETLLDGSWMELTCVVDEEDLESKSSGDVIITEKSVRFAQHETPIVNLWDIVKIVRWRLGRSVPMIIVWVLDDTKSQPELEWLPLVKVVSGRRGLPQAIRELLQPTT